MKSYLPCILVIIPMEWIYADGGVVILNRRVRINHNGKFCGMVGIITAIGKNTYTLELPDGNNVFVKKVDVELL